MHVDMNYMLFVQSVEETAISGFEGGTIEFVR